MGTALSLRLCELKYLFQKNKRQLLLRVLLPVCKISDYSFLVPHVVCTNGRQYSIFKHNTIMANQEFVYVWGTLPNSSTQKLLLSFPSISDYVSMMMDVCIPDSMTNLQLMLKSTGGSTWWKGSYVSVYDAITSSVLLTTTLSIRESMTVPFPGSLLFSFFYI